MAQFSYGRVLDVDLGSGAWRWERISPETVRQFLGGRGLAAWILTREMRPDAEPLGPENILVVACGPLAGTPVPAGSFFSVCCRSPLTGTITSSHCGGHFAAAMRWVGCDVLVVRGMADRPVYLLLDESGPALHDAFDLWGLDTGQTTAVLEQRHWPCRVAAIGPAGERMVRFAAIMADRHRAAGRGGTGAVLGSKRVKAIVVREVGRQPIEPASRDALRQVAREAQEGVRAKASGLVQFGTSAVLRVVNDAGALPTRNFAGGWFEGAEAISESALLPFRRGRRACYGCNVGCGQINQVPGTLLEGPEFETLYALGSNCGNADPVAIMRLNLLCNRVGLDTISTGGAIAFSMECFQRGLLSPNDVDGLTLGWGDTAAMESLIAMIVDRRGWGDVLARGVAEAGRALGGEAARLAVHVKGLDPAGYEPRACQGMALAYATSNRGACHLRAMMHVPELLQKLLNPYTLSGKAAVVVQLQDLMAVVDSLVMCKFVARYGFDNSLEKLGEALDAVTGWGLDAGELARVGERTYNLERLFNVRAGFKRDCDTLPLRFFAEAIAAGPSAGVRLRREEFENALSQYYQARGWSNDGVPLPDTLGRLGLAGQGAGR